MRLAHHLLRHTSGVFHFRLVVPKDLQGLLGMRIIKRSLRTRDPKLARWWAYVLGARYAQIFAKARDEGISMVKERRAKNLPEQSARKRPAVLRTGSGEKLVDYGCEVRPDGSMRFEATDKADHERLIEAIREAKKPPAWLVQAPSAPHATQASTPDMQSLAGAMETLGASLAQSLSTSAASSTPPAPARPRAIGKAADAWLKSIEADTLKKTRRLMASSSSAQPW